MMRRIFSLTIIPLICAAACLAACGNNTTHTTIEGGSGSTVVSPYGNGNASSASLIASDSTSENTSPSTFEDTSPRIPLTSVGYMELSYAEKFSVEYYDGGYSMVTIADDRFLLVPEGKDAPEGLDVPCLMQPVSSIYVASSSAMDLFLHCGALREVSLTSTAASDWSIPEIQNAVSDGSITYVGKYHSPDYETILSKNCGLVLENTMIYHSPETKEMLESLGIPVIVEWSSYEPHPLGRVEWIKLYGLLTGHEDEAEAFFNDSLKTLEAIIADSGNTSTPVNTAAPADTGAPVNTAAPADIGNPIDTVPPADTGNPIDTVPPADTGNPIDTVPPADTGNPIDTVPPADTGAPIDTVLPVDTANPIDVRGQTAGSTTEAARKTVSFFYITSTGYANVRRPGDYVSRMIELAGGDYFFPESPSDKENSLTTLNMDLETFFTTSKDADILIYNSTVEADLTSIADLIKKSPLLADFKAVNTGDVWCTNKNMFQQISGTADMISEMYSIIHGDNERKLTYLHRLS